MEAIACVADTVRSARASARELASRLAGARIAAFSLEGYLKAPSPPRGVVLCAGGNRAPAAAAFLERAARRLLWPAPALQLAEAIGGLRGEEIETPGQAAGRPPGPAAPERRRALLLEGVVDAARVRALSKTSAPRAWIVESPGRVRLSRSALARLERDGVRWSALVPVRLVALHVSPRLARSPKIRRGLVPPRTPVWVSGAGRRR
ncbi:MAG TPA: hypothetical protein VMH79_12890 [Thermoanaerobaculia bacterium]|nr:hypothetical protein [Thermoanaerobaculia bacterium]